MSRLSTKQRRARKRRRQTYQAWRGWMFMSAGFPVLRAALGFLSAWPFTKETP